VTVHLHSEQFDGWLHAQCGAGDWEAPNPRCVAEGEFEKLPSGERCVTCTRDYWPRGGDPS
jgi:hypothetical protein